MSTRARAAAVAAVVVATALGGAAPTVAAGAGSPDHVAGLLALRTGVTNTATRLDTSGAPVGAAQTLTGSKSCELGTTGADLLDFASTPASPGPGLANGAIGVRSSDTAAGASCSAVDASAAESLTVALGADGSSNGHLVASSASLDIDLKQNAVITATATLHGTTVGVFHLTSGTSGGTAGGTTQTCNAGADSGPDSGTNDHCRWEINAPTWTGGTKSIIGFDALTLTADSGSFSLTGGADGPVDDPAAPMPAFLGAYRYASVFELIPTLACGETSATSTSSTVSSTWKRLGNLSSGPCVAYPYWNTTGTDSRGSYAHFQKPLGVQTDSQALWTTSFAYSGPVPTPSITYEYLDASGQPTERTTLLTACPTGFVPGTTAPPTTPYACLASTTKATVKGVKTVTFGVYVAGDAWLRV